jgi:hypothetical protein
VLTGLAGARSAVQRPVPALLFPTAALPVNDKSLR